MPLGGDTPDSDEVIDQTPRIHNIAEDRLISELPGNWLTGEPIGNRLTGEQPGNRLIGELPGNRLTGEPTADRFTSELIGNIFTREPTGNRLTRASLEIKIVLPVRFLGYDSCLIQLVTSIDLLTTKLDV